MNAMGQAVIYLCMFLAGMSSWIVFDRLGYMPDQCLITPEAVSMLGGNERKLK
jgi:hypothetical protein